MAPMNGNLKNWVSISGGEQDVAVPRLYAEIMVRSKNSRSC